jgi:hypothetical protein
MNMLKKILLAAATSLVFAGAAGAATQGQLSSSSSVGTVTVNATIPALVQISGLTDQSVTFTAAQVAAAASTNSSVAQLAESFCVYSNTSAAGGYGVKISGFVPPQGGPSNPGNETFGLQNGGVSIPMRVTYWDNVHSQFALGIPVNGTEITGLTTTAGGNNRPNTLNCSDIGGSDAGINISFPAAGVLAAIEGTYSGTVTLTVTPT